MKQWSIWAVTVVLLWCIGFAGACARAEETDMGINSSRYKKGECLIGRAGEVYCVTDGALFANAVLYQVTDGEVKAIHSAQDISCISAHSDGILFTRTVDTLGSLLDKTITGNRYVELLEPDAGKITQWDYFASDEVILRRAFARGEFIYLWNEVDGKTILEQYSAPNERKQIFQTEQMPYEYPSFCLLDVDAGMLDKSKIKLKLFDTLTANEYTTEHALYLPQRYDEWDAFQAVLKDNVLYYLSKDGLRVYDFASHTDENLISLDGASYRGFTMSEKYIVFYGTDGTAVEVYDAETKAFIRAFSVSGWNGSHVLMDGKLYFYSPYGDGNLEIWDIEREEQTVLKLTAKTSNVTWVN